MQAMAIPSGLYPDLPIPSRIMDIVYESSPMWALALNEAMAQDRLRLDPWAGLEAKASRDRFRMRRFRRVIGDDVLERKSTRALRIMARQMMPKRDIGSVRSTIRRLMRHRFGSPTIPVHELYAAKSATQRMLDDTSKSLKEWLAKHAA